MGCSFKSKLVPQPCVLPASPAPWPWPAAQPLSATAQQALPPCCALCPRHNHTGPAASPLPPRSCCPPPLPACSDCEGGPAVTPAKETILHFEMISFAPPNPYNDPVKTAEYAAIGDFNAAMDDSNITILNEWSDPQSPLCCQSANVRCNEWLKGLWARQHSAGGCTWPHPRRPTSTAPPCAAPPSRPAAAGA